MLTKKMTLPKLLFVFTLISAIILAATFIQSTMIREYYQIEGIVVSTNFQMILENWRVGDFCKPDSESLGLVSKKGQENVAVTRKKEVIWIVEGSRLSVGPELITVGATSEEVHAILGRPTGKSGTEQESEYYYKNNLLGQRILIIRVEYTRNRVHNFVIQDSML